MSADLRLILARAESVERLLSSDAMREAVEDEADNDGHWNDVRDPTLDDFYRQAVVAVRSLHLRASVMLESATD